MRWQSSFVPVARGVGSEARGSWTVLGASPPARGCVEDEGGEGEVPSIADSSESASMVGALAQALKIPRRPTRAKGPTSARILDVQQGRCRRPTPADPSKAPLDR